MRKKAYVEIEHGTLKWEANTLTTTLAVLISLPCPIPTICCNLCRAWIHLDVSCKSLNTDRRWRALATSYCNKVLKRTRYIPGVSGGRGGCRGGGMRAGWNLWPRASRVRMQSVIDGLGRQHGSSVSFVWRTPINRLSAGSARPGHCL